MSTSVSVMRRPPTPSTGERHLERASRATPAAGRCWGPPLSPPRAQAIRLTCRSVAWQWSPMRPMASTGRPELSVPRRCSHQRRRHQFLQRRPYPTPFYGEGQPPSVVKHILPTWNGTVYYHLKITPAVTCASEGYTGTKLTWCQNICEKGYTGATLTCGSTAGSTATVTCRTAPRRQRGAAAAGGLIDLPLLQAQGRRKAGFVAYGPDATATPMAGLGIPSRLPCRTAASRGTQGIS